VTPAFPDLVAGEPRPDAYTETDLATARLKPRRIEAALRAYALAFPGATEDFPWGERAIKVKGKAFLFMRATGDEVSFSVKLPHSHFVVLDLPNTEPTHYGLGKHGWVSARYDEVPPASVEMFKMWIDESYRAVAPKKLVAQLDAGGGKSEAGGKKPAATKSAKRVVKTPR
jgi:predicted DNA-binding protein (MmcQ/YjbR family)